ncbi:MAG: FHA domain-containing protein [Gemmatimonadota bacterium]|nr:FHA domain-containing protein [Gemmatimonadota bacterium]
MSFLEIAGRRVAIAPGESAVGSDPEAAVVVRGPGVLPRHAILQAGHDGQVAIRRGDDRAEIQINGVRLGAQPSPLLHGDKVEIGGHELLFVDERRSGSTQFMHAVAPGAPPPPDLERRAPPTPQATISSGGRLVSLTDGREYAAEGSLVLGRDAACDVVVTNKDVSRRHAEILATPNGYVLVDSSTNGTFVNGQRVTGQVILARADVIRVGTDEFRFYADLAPAPPAVPSPPAASAPSAAAPPTPPPSAIRRLADTLFGVRGVQLPPGMRPPARAPAAAPVPPLPRAPAEPAAAAPSAGASPGALAHLVVRSGALKGQRVPVRTPLANIGRADYNDVVLPEDSVSTVHAKLQRREGIWMLVDLNATNGTFVDGERVTGETALAPGALLRFGEVRAFFEPAEGDEPVKGGSTKLIQSVRLPTDNP